MKRKRRHLTAEFKARVALEALKEEKTIQQTAFDEDVAGAVGDEVFLRFVFMCADEQG